MATAEDVPIGTTDPIMNGQVTTCPEPNGQNPGDAATTTAPGLSAEEIALYDRQIRLWGAHAQERIRSANILLVSLRALGTEIAKNLTLAGIRSLTIIDDEPVTEEDLGAQYFVREEDVGKPVRLGSPLHSAIPMLTRCQRAEATIPRIQELNPRVDVRSGGSLANLIQMDQNFYAPFECVIACDHDFMTLSTINTAARFANRPFYAAGIHGFYGYIFADLVMHDFLVEREKSNVATAIAAESLTRSVVGVTSKKDNNGKNIEVVKKREMYCPLILANSSPLTPDVLASRRKLKAVPALLPCIRALFEFQRSTGHLPGHGAQDLTLFTTLATTKLRELQLPAETLNSEFLRSFVQNIGAEIVPTAAFVGGRLSEDVINVLGMREQPIQNFAFFDGDALEGRIYSLYSPPPELALAGQAMGMMDASAMQGFDANGMNAINGLMGMGGNMSNNAIDMSTTNGLDVSMPAMGQVGSNQAIAPTSAPTNGADVINLD